MSEAEFQKMKRNWEKNKNQTELDAWLKTTTERNYKNIEDSDAYARLVSASFLKDPECALQLGFAVILDKPIVLLVDKNAKISENLKKIAQLIEKVDMDNPEDIKRGSQVITQFMANMVKK